MFIYIIFELKKKHKAFLVLLTCFRSMTWGTPNPRRPKTSPCSTRYDGPEVQVRGHMQVCSTRYDGHEVQVRVHKEVCSTRCYGTSHRIKIQALRTTHSPPPLVRTLVCTCVALLMSEITIHLNFPLVSWSHTVKPLQHQE